MQHERRDEILKMIKRDGSVRVSELTNRFGVSMETIRRDMEYLEKKGLLTRVYGGGIPVQHRAQEPAYMSREIKNYAEKKAIAKCAVDLVEDGDVIGIDVGTTAFEFAKELFGRNKDITVLTNALKVALTLSEDPSIRVIMIGGEVRGGDSSTSGSLAYNMTEQFHTDKYFIGVGGFDEDYGITDYHLHEASLRRLQIARTNKVIAMTDNSKIGTVAMNKICDIDSIDILVTDEGTDKKVIEHLRGEGIEVIEAKV